MDMSDKDGVNRDMISYYRDRAEEYDRNAYSEEKQRDRQPDIQKAILIIQEVFAKKNVLEIAAGTGFWTEKIAATALSVTATDINENAIEFAKEKSFPRDNVRFQVRDMYTLGDLPKHDALFGGFIFSHILKQDYDRFLDTINKYVVPGGTIVLMDNNRTLTPRPADRTDEQGNNYRLRTLEDWSKHEIAKNYPTEDEFRDLLRNRSTNMDFQDMEHYWILIYQTPTKERIPRE